MHAINADTFADAVAIGFQSRGEFGIGTPGALLDTWLGQQGDDVVLSMAVDHATAREENGLHEVEADIVGARDDHRWGIRVALSGYPQPVEGSDAPHWIVDASDVYAPCRGSVPGRRCGECGRPLGEDGAGTMATPKLDGVRSVQAPSGAIAAALAADLDTLDAQAIAGCSTHRLDAIVGDWGAVETCTIHADRDSLTREGDTVSVEGDLVAVRHSGRRIATRVLVTFEDASDPHCAPVIEPYGEASPDAASSGSGQDADLAGGASGRPSVDELRAVLPGIASVI